MIGDIFNEMFKTPDPIVNQRTELQRYAICPQQGILCEQHEKEIESHDVLPESGKIVHAIAKEAIEACGRNMQDACDYITQELPKALGRTDLQPEILRAGRALAFQLLRFATNKILLCEEPITRSLFLPTKTRGEILIVTEPDLVLATTTETILIVLDYKTGWKDRTKQEAEDDFQTCVGSWILFGKYPSVEKIIWHYLNTRLWSFSTAYIERDKMVGGTKEQPLTQEFAFEGRISQTVQIKLEGIEDAWPEPKKCSQCPVGRWCELCNGELFDFNKEPGKYLDQYIALDARLGEMKKVLDAAAKVGRKIIGSCSYYDDLPKRRQVRPSVKTLEIETEESTDAN